MEEYKILILILQLISGAITIIESPCLSTLIVETL